MLGSGALVGNVSDTNANFGRSIFNSLRTMNAARALKSEIRYVPFLSPERPILNLQIETLTARNSPIADFNRNSDKFGLTGPLLDPFQPVTDGHYEEGLFFAS